MTPPTDWHPSIPPTNHQDMNRPFTNRHLPNPHYHQPSGRPWKCAPGICYPLLNIHQYLPPTTSRPFTNRHLPNPHYHQPTGLQGKHAPGFVIPAQHSINNVYTCPANRYQLPRLRPSQQMSPLHPNRCTATKQGQATWNQQSSHKAPEGGRSEDKLPATITTLPYYLQKGLQSCYLVTLACK